MFHTLIKHNYFLRIIFIVLLVAQFVSRGDIDKKLRLFSERSPLKPLRKSQNNYAAVNVFLQYLTVGMQVGSTYAWRRRRRRRTCGKGHRVNGDSCPACNSGKYQDGNAQFGTCADGTIHNSHKQTSCKSCPFGRYSSQNQANICTKCPNGYYADTSGATSCKICASNRYSGTCNWFCSTCPTGKNSAKGSGSCQICPAGQFGAGLGLGCKHCPAGKKGVYNAGCSSCSRGKFQNQAGQTECRACGIGQYSNEEGKTDCTACSKGLFQSITGGQTCKNCAAGKYTFSTGTQFCLLCPKGLFQNNVGSTSCKNCGAGKYTESTTQSSCKSCSTGKYQWKVGQNFCEQCPLGNYQDEIGSINCKQCAKTTYQVATGQASCIGCAAGYYSDQLGLNLCKICHNGQYQNQGSQSVCKACSAGKYTYKRSQGFLDCFTCPKGYYQGSQGKSFCNGCQKNQYIASAGAAKCFLCPSGYDTRSQSQMTSCLICDEGMYSLAGNSCENCGLGKFQDIKGKSECKKCPGGYYSGTVGQVLCGTCLKGQYSPSAGEATSCTSCPAGYALNTEKGTACTLCAAGKVAGLGSENCVSCNPGMHAPSAGKSTCTECLKGKYSDEHSAKLCKSCSAGKFSNAAEVKCTECPRGYFSGAETFSCSICGSGKFSLQGESGCTNCDIGRYQSESSKWFCNNCASGKFAASKGLQSCSACVTGQYQALTRQSQCKKCSVGQSTDGSNSPFTKCTECQPGTAAQNVGLSSCSICSRGQYSNQNAADRCKLCPKGYYYSNSGGTSCNICALGMYNGHIGQKTCFSCINGKYQNANGQSSCIECQKGKYGAENGLASCNVCPAGKYSDQEKLTTCKLCKVGLYSNSKGSYYCMQCSEGRFSDTQTSTSCELCPEGYATNQKESGSCNACVAGKIADIQGSWACQDCKAGSYAKTTSQSVCKQCPLGFSAELVGSNTCSECAKGKYAENPGMSLCEDCEEGKISAYDRATACTICESGRFALKGSSGWSLEPGKCEKCPGGSPPAGKWQDKAGQGSCMECGSPTVTGSTVCNDGKCPTGMWSTITDPDVCKGTVPLPDDCVCKQCTEGQYQDERAKSSCKNCQVGKFQNINGSSRCKECSRGKYGTEEGQASETSGCKSCDAGRWSSTKALTHLTSTGTVPCKACPAGFYSNEKGKTDSSECTSCGRGKYSATIAAVSKNTCLDCSVGKFSRQMGSVNEASCIECDAGLFQSKTGESFCDSCSPGTFTAENGKSACKKCPMGQYQDKTRSTSCIEAPTGYYTKAPSGSSSGRRLNAKYEGSTSVESIPPGFYSFACVMNPSTTNASGCNDIDKCPSGWYSEDPPTGTCLKCSSGLQSSPGSAQCDICSAGTFNILLPDDTYGNCTVCPRGYYNNEEQQISCKGCTPGQYGNGVKKRKCTECSRGYFAADTARPIECEKCPIGFVQPNVKKTFCSLCEEGKKATIDDACENCGKGEYSDYPPSERTKCKSCETGHIQNKTGQTSCFACDLGRYTINGITCIQCDKGKYSNFSPVNRTRCMKCELGRVQPLKSQTNCISCSKGKYQDEPASIYCKSCTSGRYNGEIGSTVCTVCPSGFVQPLSEKDFCRICPKGSVKFDKTLCKNCSIGRFNDEDGLSEGGCKFCLPGFFESEKASIKCKPCAVGTYSVDKESTTCMSCAPGTYTDRLNASECLDCPSGWVQPDKKQEVCIICKAGSAPGREEGTKEICEDCIPGMFSGVDGSTKCESCPIGYIQPTRKKGYCTACPAGKAAIKPLIPSGSNIIAGSIACYDCKSGSFASKEAYLDKGNRSTCSICPSGFHNKLNAESKCYSCTPGKRSWNVDDDENLEGTICEKCQAGQFSSTFASSRCKYCPRGYVQPEKESSHCFLCAEGKYMTSSDGLNGQLLLIEGKYTHCLDCVPGTYGEGDASNRSTDLFWSWSHWSKLSPLKCLSCPTGWYNIHSGQSKCTASHVGSIAIKSVGENAPHDPFHIHGATGTKSCPSGYYQPKVAQTECLGCPSGYYQPETGTTKCLQCAPGKSSGGYKAQKNCKKCDAGTFSDKFGNKECKSCTIGFYQDILGSVDCKNCRPGKSSTKRAKFCVLQQINTKFLPPYLKSLRPLNRLSNQMVLEIVLNVSDFHPESNPAKRLIPYSNSADRVALFIQWSNRNGLKNLPDLNSRASWPDIECKKSIRTVDTDGMYLNTMYFLCLDENDLVKWGIDKSSSDTQSAEVTIPIIIEAEHKGPIWEDSVYIEAAFYLASGTTGIWTPTYGGTPSASECLNSENNQEYLRTHPSDNTCKPMLDLLQLRTDCFNRTGCTDKSMLTEMNKIKCVGCPDGGNCLSEQYKLNDGRIVPKPGMFLWNIGQLEDYWRVPWAPMHGDILNNFGYLQEAPQFFHRCPRKGACYGVKGVSGMNDDVPDKYWGSLFDFPGGWKNSTALNKASNWSCPHPHPLTTCKAGTEGPLCSICSHMWVRLGGECQACYPMEARVGVVVIAVISTVILLSWLQRFLRQLPYKYRGAFRDLSRQLIAVLNLCQILVTVTVMLEVPWPDNLVQFFEFFDFVNFDFTALTGAACDKAINFHVAFLMMSTTPIVVLMLLTYQFLRGRVQTALTIRKLKKDNKRRQIEIMKCYEELFQVVDTNKNGVLCANEVINLLKLVGYRDTKEHILSEKKAGRLIRGIAGSKYATEMTKEMFLSEIKSGKLAQDLDIIFSTHENIKRAKKNKSKSMIHSGIDVLAWNEKRKLVTTTFNIAMTVLLLLHTPVSKKVFQFFDCDQIGAGDWSKSFLRVDYSIPCSNAGKILPSYASFLPIVIAVLSSFTIAMPLFLSYSLWHNRQNLYKPMIILRFGWLYDRMRPGAEHWEIVEMTRKMTLTGLIVFFPQNPIIRACFCVCICVIYTAALNYYRPHKNTLVFWVEQICYIVALLLYVIAMVFETGLDERSAEQVGSMFITILSFLFLGLMFALLRTIYLVRRADHTELFGITYNTNKTTTNEKNIEPGDISGHVQRAMIKRRMKEEDMREETRKERIKEEKMNLNSVSSERKNEFKITKIRPRRKTKAHKEIEALVSNNSEKGSKFQTEHKELFDTFDNILGLDKVDNVDYDHIKEIDRILGNLDCNNLDDKFDIDTLDTGSDDFFASSSDDYFASSSDDEESLSSETKRKKLLTKLKVNNKIRKIMMTNQKLQLSNTKRKNVLTKLKVNNKIGKIMMTNQKLQLSNAKDNLDTSSEDYFASSSDDAESLSSETKRKNILTKLKVNNKIGKIMMTNQKLQRSNTKRKNILTKLKVNNKIGKIMTTNQKVGTKEKKIRDLLRKKKMELIPKHPEFDLVKTKLQRLDSKKFNIFVNKLVRNGGNIEKKKLVKLLERFSVKDINGLVKYMLEIYSDDDGKTISEVQFRDFYHDGLVDNIIML